MNKSLLHIDPELAKEWDYNKNSINPSEVTANTHRKAWWLCPKCGYSYFSSIANRHRNKTACPVCSNQTLCVGINDLQTKYPNIAKEWSNKNNKLPSEVIAGGHTKYYFICSKCGNEWKTTINERKRGRGCPKCSASLHTSIPEQVIFECLKNTGFNVKNSYKPKWLNGKEIDIYLVDYQIAIEYDGSGWHKNVNRDIDKGKLIRKNKIKFIRLREPNCPKINDDSIQIFTKTPDTDGKYIESSVKELYKVLSKETGLIISFPKNYNVIYSKAVAKLRNKDLDKSFLSTYQNLMKDWNFNKNTKIDPKRLSPKSHTKAWWKCSVCGYEWESSINRRTSQPGCPYCTNEVVWVGHNDVATLRKDLLKEWDYCSNTIKPTELSPHSSKKITWKCKACGNKWTTAMYNRANGHGCPRCSRNIKYVKNLDTGEIYDSIKQACKETGITHIGDVCNHKAKTAGGYHWGFVSEE